MLPAWASLLCVLTWNIHGGRNHEKLIREMNTELRTCQVWSLQEAGQETDAWLGEVAEIQGRQQVQKHSNRILSTLPIVDGGAVPLPPDGHRSAVFADIQVAPDQLVRVYTFHLTYKHKGNPFVGSLRAQEIEGVLEHARSWNGPVVLAGDFNSLGYFLGGSSREPAIRSVLREGFEDAHGGRNRRTHTWAGHVDWIFSRFLELIRGDFGRKSGSDHIWLRAFFNFPQDGEP